MVSGHHDDLDTGGLALGDRRRDSRAGGVDEGHEAEEDQTDSGVGVDAFRLLVLPEGEVSCVVLFVTRIELVAFGVFSRREFALSEAEAAESIAGEL